jgi:AraC-like DNA-binding protein
MKTLTLFSPRGIVLFVLLSLAIPTPTFSNPKETTQAVGKENNQTQFDSAKSKYRLGYYAEAIPLLKACMDHFENKDPQRYLEAVHYLSLAYFMNGEYGRSSLAAELGKDDSISLDNAPMRPYFNQSLGLNTYGVERYEEAIALLQPTLSAFTKKGDYENAGLANLYLAKSYSALKQKTQAIQHYAAVAALFSEHHYTHPALRTAFEALITHYGAEDDTDKKAYYVNQLLQADAFMNSRFPHLNQNISKQYDTEELLQMQRENSRVSTVAILLGCVVLFAVLFLSYWYYRRWKAQTIALEEIPIVNSLYDESAQIVTTEISAEVEHSILKKLEKFEKDQRFLEPELTLTKLAQLLDSNNRYVAAIIAKHRNKRITDYINDLKIDHLVTLLQTDPQYRKYTHKALAEEIAFGTTQHFARAFAARTGTPLTEFVRKLKEKD